MDGSAEIVAPRHYSKTPLTFLLLSILCQVVAFGAVLALLRTAQFTPSGTPLSFAVIGGGVGLYATIAWGCAALLDLPPLWRVFNALLLPLVLAAETLALPRPVYGACIAAALVLYLPTLWTRVPYYPTSTPMYEAVERALPKEAVKFIDLGCGFAGLLCYLARKRPDSTFTGVELSPLAYGVSKLRVQLAGLENVSIKYQSLWDVPLEKYSVVYAFLAPPPMSSLWEKVKEELPPGGILLVNSFPISGEKSEVITVAGTRQEQLFIYRVSR